MKIPDKLKHPCRPSGRCYDSVMAMLRGEKFNPTVVRRFARLMWRCDVMARALHDAVVGAPVSNEIWRAIKPEWTGRAGRLELEKHGLYVTPVPMSRKQVARKERSRP